MQGHKVYLYEQGEKLCMMCFKKNDSLGKLLMEADIDDPVRMVEMTNFCKGEIFEKTDNGSEPLSICRGLLLRAIVRFLLPGAWIYQLE